MPVSKSIKVLPTVKAETFWGFYSGVSPRSPLFLVSFRGEHVLSDFTTFSVTSLIFWLHYAIHHLHVFVALARHLLFTSTCLLHFPSTNLLLFIKILHLSTRIFFSSPLSVGVYPCINKFFMSSLLVAVGFIMYSFYLNCVHK